MGGIRKVGKRVRLNIWVAMSRWVGSGRWVRGWGQIQMGSDIWVAWIRQVQYGQSTASETMIPWQGLTLVTLSSWIWVFMSHLQKCKWTLMLLAQTLLKCIRILKIVICQRVSTKYSSSCNGLNPKHKCICLGHVGPCGPVKMFKHWKKNV